MLRRRCTPAPSTTGSGLRTWETGREGALIAQTRYRMAPGISRVVSAGYSSYGGQIAAIVLQSAGRSAAEAVRARALNRSAITCTVTSGRAERFSYQAGCWGAPPREAATT